MKKILFTVAVFLSIQAVVFAQGSSPVLDNVVSKIKATITDRIVEKAYLHFDRPYPCYVAGDVMYFKAYVTMGELHEPSRISGMLHVDLIGKNDALLQTKIIPLTNGVGWGDFSLADTLQKGSYRIRAYTNYMRNGDHSYYFDRYISVSSINNVDKVMATAKKAGQPSLQFFPEGGALVADIRTKIAFKAIGADGLGVNLKGVIFDNDNKEAAKIESSHFGMGVFDFIPETGKKYVAKVTYSDGSKATVNLPDVAAKGIALVVNTDDPSKISIEIRTNRPYFKENINKALNLLVYWSGSVKTVNTKLDNQVLGLDMPTANMMTGILQVTLFSENGEPLCERLAFIQNNDLLNMAITSNKPAYAKREGVTLNINAKNKEDGAARGSFSISVIDESKIMADENAESTILTNLLLTPDLKGYIEKPNYYFANVTKETRSNLDALMLTQGYRRFVWKQLLNENTVSVAASYKPERSFNITGNVKTKAGDTVPNAQVTLLQSGGALKLATTDAQGNFSFPDMIFETGANFVLKTNSKSGKNAAVITIDKPLPGAIIDPGNGVDASYNPNADILASLQNSQRDGLMTASNDSRVYLKNDRTAAPKRNDNYRSSNLGGPGHADQVINGNDFENAPSLVTALNGVARDVDFQNGIPYLKTGQVTTASGSVSNPMMVVVDGVLDGGQIDAIEPRIVETVEVLKGPSAAIYGVRGGAGVIVITTRQGLPPIVNTSKEMSPGVYSFSPEGFYKAKEFYSPQYNVAQANKLPDNRTTIFWKPNVLTDVDGNASVNFFNSDGTGTYRVVIEGMDAKGNLGRQVFKYKVQ